MISMAKKKATKKVAKNVVETKAKKVYSKEEQASFAEFELRCKEHWTNKQDRVIKFVDVVRHDKMYRIASNSMEKWAIRKLTGRKTLTPEVQEALSLMGFEFKPAF